MCGVWNKDLWKSDSVESPYRTNEEADIHLLRDKGSFQCDGFHDVKPIYHRLRRK
jgi:hypothetical protein